MPVDKSKPPKSNAKRPQEAVNTEYISQSVPGANGITHARELEVKRSRGKSKSLHLVSAVAYASVSRRSELCRMSPVRTVSLFDPICCKISHGGLID
jgi:hypothetical protein